ncbi:heavy metal-binding domain-containing protein [Acidiphilium sp.]|uniref:heavy metal-binding domain-containing protein n=1 Tax=Acidiphilium sp. TaxID=527 RepID=UPI003D06A8AA
MSFKDLLKGVVGAVVAGNAANDPAELARQAARMAEWHTALRHNGVPGFVGERLRHTAVGRLPWVSTASPGDLLTLRTHGIKTLGMVSGNCWYHFGYSWTEGHRDGWHTAIARMQHEAALMGAHAVVEVRLATRQSSEPDDRNSMDYSATGTAISIAGMADERDPMVATVSQLEFARLLEAGILPVGLAVGAHYEWMADPYGWADAQQSYFNQELEVLAGFQRRVRQSALNAMRSHARTQGGTGVLGRVQFTEMFREPGNQEEPTQYLCRHIAFGTVIQHRKGEHRSLKPRAVLMTRKSRSKSLEATESVI